MTTDFSHRGGANADEPYRYQPSADEPDWRWALTSACPNGHQVTVAAAFCPSCGAYALDRPHDPPPGSSAGGRRWAWRWPGRRRRPTRE